MPTTHLASLLIDKKGNKNKIIGAYLISYVIEILTGIFYSRLDEILNKIRNSEPTKNIISGTMAVVSGTSLPTNPITAAFGMGYLVGEKQKGEEKKDKTILKRSKIVGYLFGASGLLSVAANYGHIFPMIHQTVKDHWSLLAVGISFVVGYTLAQYLNDY